jgi:tight adherence protein B
MQDPTVLLGLMASVTLGVCAIAGVLGAAAWSQNQASLRRLVGHVEPHVDPSDFSTLDKRIERLLATTEFGSGFSRDLGQLGLGFRPGRLVMYGITAAGAAFVAATLRTGSPYFGLVALIGVLMAEVGLVRYRAGQCWQQYRVQLPEALHVIASALAAGASLNQAMNHAAREMVPPLQGELQRLVEDVEVGKTLEESLFDLKTRVPLPEFDMVIASLLIQQRSGGNLGELLNEVAHIIKQNEELRREMQVLTSQAMVSARLVSLLPVGLFVYLLVTNRSYLGPLLTTRTGQAMLAVGTIFIMIGYWVVVRIATYKEYDE